jgi:hypothetical protein
MNKTLKAIFKSVIHNPATFNYFLNLVIAEYKRVGKNNLDDIFQQVLLADIVYKKEHYLFIKPLF